MQLAPSVAADCNQRDIGALVPFEAVPCRAQDLIDEPGPVLDQPADVTAGPEALVEHLARLADRLLVGGDGAGLERQFRLELATIEQFRVDLGHTDILRLGYGCGFQAEVRAMVSSLRRVKIS